MIDVMKLQDVLKKARAAGAIKGTDVLVPTMSSPPGMLNIMRGTEYAGYLDLRTGSYHVFDVVMKPSQRNIKGLSASNIIIDEITTVLEQGHDHRPDLDGFCRNCGVETGDPQ